MTMQYALSMGPMVGAADAPDKAKISSASQTRSETISVVAAQSRLHKGGEAMPRVSRRRASGEQLVQQLNAVVAQLIKENRQLKRRVDKLTTSGTSVATGAIDKGLRAIQRRAEKALAGQPRRHRSVGSTHGGNGRRKKTAAS